jgi:hypothetical protein
MAKRPDLRQALKPRNEIPVPQPTLPQDNAAAAAPKSPHFRPSREGKANVTGYFPPSVKKQLRILAADRDTTIQDLLAEALNDLFAKHGRPEIVPVETVTAQ